MANYNSTRKSFYLNGEALRLILKSKGITQQELAKAIGVGKNTIYRAISFNRLENKENFEKICTLLDVDPIVLLDKDFLVNYAKLPDNVNEDNTINTDRINEYISTYGKGFRRYDITSFNSEYINQFFKNSPGTEMLSDEMKTFLFSKIIDSREKYLHLLFEFLDTRSEEEEITDFYKRFEAWFLRNVKNKSLKD